MPKTSSDKQILSLKYMIGFLATSWTFAIIALLTWDFNHLRHTVSEIEAEFFLVGGLWMIGIIVLLSGGILFFQNIKKQRKEEYKYQILFEASPVGITIIDRNRIVQNCNPALSEIIGYSHDEIVGQPYIRFLSDNQNALKDHAIERALGGERNIDILLTLKHKSGKIIWTENSVTPIESDGGIELVQVATLDISSRIEAERESERLATLVVQASESIVLTDLDGNIEYVNPFFEKLTGYTNKEILGQNPNILRSNHQDTQFYADLWKTISSGETWRGRFVNKRKDGSLYHEEATIFPIKNAKGEVVSYAAIKQDISEQMQTKIELREQKEYFEKIVDTSNAIIVGLDKNHKIRLFNKGAGKITGYEAQEVMGKDWFKLFFVDEITTEMDKVWEDAWGMSFHAYTNPIKIKNGDKRVISWQTTGIYEGADDEKHIQLSIGEDITERMQAEKEILHGRNQLESIFRVAPTGIGVVIDRKIQFVNDRFSEMLGYTREELVGQLSRMVYPSDAEFERVGKYKYEQIQEKGTGTIETFFCKKDGSLIDVLLSSTPLDLQDLSKGVTFTALDITERVQAEKEKERLAMTIEQAAESVILIDLEGKIEYVNPFFEKISGYTAEEIMGRSLRLLDSGHEDENFHAAVWQMVSSGKTWRGEFVNKRKNGSLFTEKVVIFPIKDEKGEIISYAEIKQDITEQVRHDQEIESLSSLSQAMRSVERRDELISVILDKLIALFEIRGAVLLLNDTGRGDFIQHYGAGVWDAWDEKETAQIAEANAQVTEAGLLCERNDIQSDSIFSSSFFDNMSMVTCSPLIVQNLVIGTLWVGGAVSIADDDLQIFTAMGDMAANAIHRQTLHENMLEQMVQLQLAQESLIRAEKLSAMGELVAGVAHELNNPLMTIIFYAQALLEKPLPSETKSDLTAVFTAGQRAASIVKGLRDFSRPQPPQHEIAQINDIITGSLDLLNYEMENKKICRETCFEANLPLASVDTQQMQQVFINLLKNAFQAFSSSQAQGCLKITTEMGASLHPDNKNHEAVIRVIIKDNGPGISAETLPNIFDPFFTTKRVGEGTGLGLSICHSIVNKHGGIIWATSEEEQGATFFIELPMLASSEGEPETLPEKEKEMPSAKKEGTILIIDDEESLLTILSRRLTRLGYKVDIAPSADAGLLALAQTFYDHILSDLRLPDMSGIELYQRVAAETPEVAKRFIFMTGDSARAATSKTFKENAIPYLEKPFEIEKLIDLLERE